MKLAPGRGPFLVPKFLYSRGSDRQCCLRADSDGGADIAGSRLEAVSRSSIALRVLGGCTSRRQLARVVAIAANANSRRVSMTGGLIRCGLVVRYALCHILLLS